MVYGYGNKYFLNFGDYSGNTYVVNLNKKDYSGTTSQIVKYPVSPVIHTYRGGRDNINSVISGSEVNINFYVTPDENNRYDEIFESDYKDWQIDILKTGLIPDGYELDSEIGVNSLPQIFTGNTKMWGLTTSNNIPQSISTSVLYNDLTLSWNNDSYTVTPASFIVLINTDTSAHPIYGKSSYIKVNDDNLTGYTFNNLGRYPGDYSFAVAINTDTNLNGINNYQFSPSVFVTLENYNVPLNLAGYDDGANHVVLTWDNPIGGYTTDVQSFVINILREITPGNWSSEPLVTFNDDGSATTYAVPIALTGNYRFQIAVAELTDGFERQTFTSLIEVGFVNHYLPPNFSLNPSLLTTVYFGGSKITPIVSVSGGTGFVNLLYAWDIGGSTHDETQSITLSGGTTIFSKPLTDRYTIRNADFNIELIADAGYGRYGTTSRSYTSPNISGSGKVEGVSLNRVSNTVTISWTPYTDASAVAGWGYVIGRYRTDEGVITRFYVSGMGSTSYADDVSSLTNGVNYSYFVMASSVSNPLDQTEPNIYQSSVTYPDMVNFTK